MIVPAMGHPGKGWNYDFSEKSGGWKDLEGGVSRWDTEGFRAVKLRPLSWVPVVVLCPARRTHQEENGLKLKYELQ